MRLRLVGEHDRRIWRVLGHHVDEASTKAAYWKVQTIAIDEKPSRPGRRYVTFVMNLDLRCLLLGTMGRTGDKLAVLNEDLKAHGNRPEQIQEVCSNCLRLSSRASGNICRSRS